MTFYEAALEVLRRTGRPLHYKKITEIAIRDELLSHVGKTPEVTMSARLNQEVKREEHSSLVRARPGVFTLRDEVAERLNQEAAERDEASPSAEPTAEPAEQEDDEPKRGRRRRSGVRISASRRGARRGARSRRRDASGEEAVEADAKSMEYAEDPELFDDPNSEEEESEERAETNNERRSRRGRRRGGRGRKRRDEARQAEPSEERDRAPSEEKPEAARGRGRGGRQERAEAKEERAKSNGRKEQSEGQDEAPQRGRGRRRDAARREEASGHDEPSGAQKERGRRSEAKPNGQRGPQRAATDHAHLEQGPVRLEGLAEAAHTVLSAQRERGAMAIEELAEAIYAQKLVKFHTHDPAMTTHAAIVNDNQARSRRGHRPLFQRYADRRWGLSGWGMTDDALRKEQQILSLSEECRRHALAHLGRALLDVQTEALEQIMVAVMEGRGYRDIKVSKRSAEGDVYFTADWRQGLSDVRVCIMLVGDASAALGRQAVTDLRGTLHHHAASEGVIVHLGEIKRKAIEEAREEKLAPMTLIDCDTFVELLAEQGLGVRRFHTPILMVDQAYLAELAAP